MVAKYGCIAEEEEEQKEKNKTGIVRCHRSELTNLSSVISLHLRIHDTA